MMIKFQMAVDLESQKIPKNLRQKFILLKMISQEKKKLMKTNIEKGMFTVKNRNK